MLDEHDFAIDEGELQAAAGLSAESPPPPDPESAPAPLPAAAPVEPPRVLIQYRNRGLHAALLPPLLILIAAVVITSYQRQARLRPAPPPELRPRPTGPAKAANPASPRGRIIMVEAAGTGASVEPITIRSAMPPPPPTAPDPPASEPVMAAAPAATPATALAEPEAPTVLADASLPPISSPFSPLETAAIPKDPPPLEPPAPLTSAAAGPLWADSPELAFAPAEVVAALTRAKAEPAAREPKLTKEQLNREFQLEAQQKQAEQANLGRAVEASRDNEFFESIRKAQDARQPFHDELRRVLQELGKDAGAEIKNLCDRYGRDTHPDIHKVVTHALQRGGALHRDVKIKMLRMQGLPEPAILDVLANELDPLIRGKRGGPKDRNGVRVVAAKLLLTFPPPTLPEAISTTAPGMHTSAAVRTPATP